MSEFHGHDRVSDLLRRIDEITKESERLRRTIEDIRGSSPDWPDRRRVSRVFDEGIGPAGRNRTST
jgi:hypothetical protein